MRFLFTIRAVYNFCYRYNLYNESSLIKILNIIFNNSILSKNTLNIVKKAIYNCWILI
jgi:hypothetical protein